MARRLSLVAGVAVALLAAGGACAQEPPSPFFRGKQINMIVGSSAGGGYDIYARLIARHMSRYIPAIPPSWRPTCRARPATPRPHTSTTSRPRTAR